MRLIKAVEMFLNPVLNSTSQRAKTMSLGFPGSRPRMVVVIDRDRQLVFQRLVKIPACSSREDGLGAQYRRSKSLDEQAVSQYTAKRLTLL